MPNYTLTILCLANSRKLTGRCIAGRIVTDDGFGAWVRPVSERPNREISEEERRFSNGRDPKVLDIICIPFKSKCPHDFQTENHVIDDRFNWSLKGRASWDDVLKAVDRSNKPLWQNHGSSWHGANDRVMQGADLAGQGSLKLIAVRDLSVHVGLEGEGYSNAKRKLRARFTYAHTIHILAITDPILERDYLSRPDGDFEIGRALLCVSLSEPYNGYVYKLVASVILPVAH